MNPHWSVSQEHGPADVRTGKKILFVDDDKAWRDVVTVALQDAGYEIRTAKDASEAMLLTEGSNLGLIILDLDLGGEDGLMLMKFFKHNQPGVPIILYTGMKHDEDAIHRDAATGGAAIRPQRLAGRFASRRPGDGRLVCLGVFPGRIQENDVLGEADITSKTRCITASDTRSKAHKSLAPGWTQLD